MNKRGEDFEKRGTNQFVVLGGELGEPLVELQDSYNGHQIPEEEQTGRKEKVIAATIYVCSSAPP